MGLGLGFGQAEARSSAASRDGRRLRVIAGSERCAIICSHGLGPMLYDLICAPG